MESRFQHTSPTSRIQETSQNIGLRRTCRTPQQKQPATLAAAITSKTTLCLTTTERLSWIMGLVLTTYSTTCACGHTENWDRRGSVGQKRQWVILELECSDVRRRGGGGEWTHIRREIWSSYKRKNWQKCVRNKNQEGPIRKEKRAQQQGQVNYPPPRHSIHTFTSLGVECTKSRCTKS